MAEKVKQYRLPDDPITLDELKSFLWAAATHLRGQIDAAGYKEYIFPLLFFKRISDVYDEQFEGFVCEGGVEYAGMQVEDLPIRIPDGAHWRDVREVTENVGNKLVEAFIAIEQANPAKEMDGRKIGGLEGIFGPKDGWTNKAKMPDNIITSLIEDFSKYTLSLKACPADEMGQAYEYLVGKFADDAGNTAQEFYTNRTVVQLMAEILQPQPNESIYDPTCGSGGMLVKCLDYLRNKGAEWQSVQVFGQEVNGLTSSIARMNLYLNGVEDFSIACADTLEHPAFLDGSHLRKFDIVLANPPYSMEACIIICKNRKEDSHKGKVIFIDAKGEVSRKNAESYLENTHIQKIISAYENFEDIEYFAKVADINDIDNNKSLLSIQSYVKQKGTNEIYILDESLPKWIEASRSMHIEVANLLSMLKYE